MQWDKAGRRLERVTRCSSCVSQHSLRGHNTGWATKLSLQILSVFMHMWQKHQGPLAAYVKEKRSIVGSLYGGFQQSYWTQSNKNLYYLFKTTECIGKKSKWLVMLLRWVCDNVGNKPWVRILTLLWWRPCGCVWARYKEEAAVHLCPSEASCLHSPRHSAQTEERWKLITTIQNVTCYLAWQDEGRAETSILEFRKPIFYSPRISFPLHLVETG